MATQPQSIKPDLGSLRIGGAHRKPGAGAGKRFVIIVLVILPLAAIAAATYAFRNQKPVVQVMTATKAEAGGRQSLLNASGCVTLRRGATTSAKLSGRGTCG